MKQPRKQFLRELASALGESAYPNVAGRLLAGFLWAVYPEWYDSNLRRIEKAEDRKP